MNKILVLIAKLINRIAIVGAGLPSAGFSFQPDIPEQLQKRNF